MLTEKKKLLYKKIINGDPINLNFKFISADALMIIKSIVTRELEKHDLHFISNTMITILRELLVNSLKANVKRIFFQINNLDINNQQDYDTGIKKFKKEAIEDLDSFKDNILKSNLTIIFNITEKSDSILFVIQNNTVILPEEMKRINDRISLVTQQSDFINIYENVGDDTEGAGLGLSLVIMLLKSIGVDPSAFKISSENGITVTSVQVPYILKPVGVITTIKEQILDEITGIPTFPENIITLMKMCSNPDTNIDKIANIIKSDISITSDVIKLSNSAGFISNKRINDVREALIKIGLNNLKLILIAGNARKIMENKYKKFEEIWAHCSKVAFYSRELALKYKFQSGEIENAYTAGLLHDIGKIILLTVDDKGMKKIADLVQDRDLITATVLEEMSIGISHAEIGSLISEKWNFPNFLSEVAKYHHSPLNISDEFKDVGFCAYLANMIAGIESKRYSYYYIEDAVLDKFNIKDESELMEISKSLKKSYELSQNNP
ncbi:MAG: HDOD domain-containing protein [Spirochaetes bacterium]|nr:HDOD domain-containing protein [Spirochaetota bacterium]